MKTEQLIQVLKHKLCKQCNRIYTDFLDKNGDRICITCATREVELGGERE